MMLDVESSSYISMCMTCEQTFSDEYIYNNHTCEEGDEDFTVSPSKPELIIADNGSINTEKNCKSNLIKSKFYLSKWSGCDHENLSLKKYNF